MEWTRIAELTPCPTHHLLILDGLIPAARLCPYGLRPSKPERSLCLHALSSFQRTSVAHRNPVRWRWADPDARSARPVAPLRQPLVVVRRTLQGYVKVLSVSTLFCRTSAVGQPWSSESEGASVFGDKKLLHAFRREQFVRCLPVRAVSRSCLAANSKPAGHTQTESNYTWAA